jgi:PBP1b-binding outer membrane lipoprotein LpoB
MKRLIYLALAAVCLSSCRSAQPQSDQTEETVQKTAEPVSETAVPENHAFDFENRTVMLNSDYEMPILGLGTYALDHDTCVNSVKTLLAEGGRLIDTAHMYHNEEAVGEGVRLAM